MAKDQTNEPAGDGATTGALTQAPSNEAAALAAQAARTREPPTGIAAALEACGGESHVIWRCNGPRKGTIAEIAGILVEGPEGELSVIIATANTRGGFKLYGETKGGA